MDYYACTERTALLCAAAGLFLLPEGFWTTSDSTIFWTTALMVLSDTAIFGGLGAGLGADSLPTLFAICAATTAVRLFLISVLDSALTLSADYHRGERTGISALATQTAAVLIVASLFEVSFLLYLPDLSTVSQTAVGAAALLHIFFCFVGLFACLGSIVSNSAKICNPRQWDREVAFTFALHCVYAPYCVATAVIFT